jgi:hypothetical protein
MTLDSDARRITGDVALSEHRGKAVRLVVFSIIWLPFLLGGILMFLAPLLAWLFVRESFSGYVFIWTPIGLLIGLGAYFCIADNLRNIGRRVLVHTEGIEEQRGRQVRRIRWDDVERVYQQSKRNRFGHLSQEFKLQVRDDPRQAVFTHRLTQMEVLRDRILAETHRRLFPKAATALESGADLDFGCGLKANRQGVGYGDHFVAWQDIKTVGVDLTGNFRVFEKGRMMSPINVPVQMGFNLHVLAGLVAHFGVGETNV